jgi:hypothetical protein
LASVDITVSVDPADSITAFESEKITALSNFFWCKFSRRSAVRMASISQSKAVECCPSGSRRKVHSKCQSQPLGIRLFESHL